MGVASGRLKSISAEPPIPPLPSQLLVSLGDCHGYRLSTQQRRLVHGAFVDGSTSRAVYDLVTRDGYHVAVVHRPTLSLRGDTAAMRLIVDAPDDGTDTGISIGCSRIRPGRRRPAGRGAGHRVRCYVRSGDVRG